jgi:CheY-like chemotaxis protein
MRIMFIDDESRRMKMYVDELEESGHTVSFQSSVDSALATLREEGGRLDLVVIDVSISPGMEYKYEDTDGGTRTGIALYATIRRDWPDLKVMVFTNVPDSRLAEKFSNEDSRVCLFARKPDILPFQLVEMVEEFVSAGRDGTIQ